MKRIPRVVSDKAKLVGESLCQGEIGHYNNGSFYGLFLAPEIKYCLIKDEYGNIEEHKHFEGFTISQRLLDKNQFCDMLRGSKNKAKLPLSWTEKLCFWDCHP